MHLPCPQPFSARSRSSARRAVPGRRASSPGDRQDPITYRSDPANRKASLPSPAGPSSPAARSHSATTIGERQVTIRLDMRGGHGCQYGCHAAPELAFCAHTSGSQAEPRLAVAGRRQYAADLGCGSEVRGGAAHDRRVLAACRVHDDLERRRRRARPRIPRRPLPASARMPSVTDPARHAAPVRCQCSMTASTCLVIAALSARPDASAPK